MAYSYPAVAVPFSREAVVAQLRTGWVPATWLVIRADRAQIWQEIGGVVARLVVAMLFVPAIAVYPALLRLLNASDLQRPPGAFLVVSAPEAAFWIIFGVLLSYSAIQAVVVGRRSLAGGFAQTLIVTPEGFVVDGGPSRVVPFAEVAAIKKRNWMVLHVRREAFADTYSALRITHRNGSTDVWQVDSRFGPSHAVQELIIGAFARYQQVHGQA